MKFDDFMKHCTACGGNWTAMLLTGIKAVAPELYDELPDRDYEFDEVAFIVNHMCYDRPHFRYNISPLSKTVIEFTDEGKFTFREATAEEINMTAMEFHTKYNDPFYVEKQKSGESREVSRISIDT